MYVLDIYTTKFSILRGTKYSDIYPRAISIYKQICGRTKRKPYIRSKYFKKEKVFLDYFWAHIREKNMRDRVRRLRFYNCALDLIENSILTPVIQKNPMKYSESLYRFIGQTISKERFFVHIKEDRRKQKHFISVFPFE
jgi:hypothetical protein